MGDQYHYDDDRTVSGGGPGAAGLGRAQSDGVPGERSRLHRVEPRGKEAGHLRRDAVELHVWVADGSAPGAERHLAGSASCRIEVTGVDGLYQHCQQLGVVHPNAPLQDQWWGTREFGVLDPDNNLISLYEWVPPAAPPEPTQRVADDPPGQGTTVQPPQAGPPLRW